MIALKTYTLDKQIRLDILDTTIIDSGCVQGYLGMNYYSDQLDVFGDSFDEAALDLIVDSHTWTPEAVFKLTGTNTSPVDLDYDIYGLHKKRTFVQGELVLTEYYRNYDGTTYSDLVVDEGREYTRDANNLAQYRTQISRWYLTNDEVGATKTTTKYYTVHESVAESETRRANLVADAKLYTLSQIGIANCWDFLQSINVEIDLYIQGATQYLKDSIMASTKPYLNETMKGTLVYILTIN
jgi:hypothetical protein